jgi:hypothetical protein
MFTLRNRYKEVLQEASLIFSPFYLFEFKIDFERTDRSGRNHRIRNEGNYEGILANSLSSCRRSLKMEFASVI